MDLTLEEHLEDVVDALCSSALVPLLGAGANLSDRLEGERWTPGENLPSGDELAEYLADKLHYPEPQTAGDLLRVSQYAQARRGDGTLYRFLHEVFTQRYVPTRLHGFLATLPARLELATGRRRHQLIVTTNYDDALEQAFAAAGEPYDVVWYERPAGPESSGRAHCVHRTQDGRDARGRARERVRARVARRPQRDPQGPRSGRPRRRDRSPGLVRDQRGPLHRVPQRTQLNDLVPGNAARHAFTSHFLFLGYRMTDWNVRVILHQIWRRAGASSKPGRSS